MEWGWSLEEALNVERDNRADRIKSVKDHKGIEYASFRQMCMAYEVEPGNVRYRLNSGWSLKDALEYKSQRVPKNKIVSIVGTYGYAREMAKALKEKESVVYSRLYTLRWDVDVVAVVPERGGVQFKGVHKDTGKSYYEVDGINGYKTARELIMYYRPDLLERYDALNPQGVYRPNIKENFTYAKEKEYQSKKNYSVNDGLGGKFKNVDEMCNHYNISKSELRMKLKQGYSLIDAIRGGKVSTRVVSDYRGNMFKTFGTMCKAYHRSIDEVIHRLCEGANLREALDYERWDKDKVEVLYGTANSIRGLCNYAVADPETLRDRLLNKGWDIDVAIVCPKYVNIEAIGLDIIEGRAYYKVIENGRIMTARDIIGHLHPELVDRYDELNPRGEYRPYRGTGK